MVLDLSLNSYQQQHCPTTLVLVGRSVAIDQSPFLGPIQPYGSFLHEGNLHSLKDVRPRMYLGFEVALADISFR